MIEISRTASFDFGSSNYRALFDCSNASPFQHPEWLMAFYNNLLKESHLQALVIIGRSMETGELRAVIPLVRRSLANRVIVEFAFGGVSDYCCAVVHPDLYSHLEQTPLLTKQLLAALGHHDVLCIEPVRQCDVALWEKLLGTTAEKLPFGSHSVRYGKHYSQWRADNLGSKKCSQIGRKMRRLAELGKVVFRLLPTEEAADALAWASRFRQGRFPGDPIQQQEVLKFYREVAEAGAKSGFARTYLLSCDGNPIALCFGLVDGDSYCYLVLACDYNVYGRYSPGILVLDRAMADWAAQGGKVFDFTIGDEPFKTTFRCARTAMFRFTRVNTIIGKDYVESE